MESHCELSSISLIVLMLGSPDLSIIIWNFVSIGKTSSNDLRVWLHKTTTLEAPGTQVGTNKRISGDVKVINQVRDRRAQDPGDL